MRSTGARRGRIRITAALPAGLATSAALALVAGGLAAAAPAAAVPASPLAPLTNATSFEDGRYIVSLADAPLAAYDGGIEGYRATTPDAGEQLDTRQAPVQKYQTYLQEQQEEVAGEVGADVAYSYTVTNNGFAAELTAAQAAKLSADKRVTALELDELKQVTAVPSHEFLGLAGTDGVWATLGGTKKSGKGVVVGIIDTGIAPENPSFAGAPLKTKAGKEPYLAGDVITYRKGDGGTFTGLCQPGEAGQQFTGDECSTKIVGARYYVDGFGTDGLGGIDVGEYISPRDGDGHGSHTASTAAGDYGVEASTLGVDFGRISGVAPAARIAAYKACWSGPDPLVTTDDGCATSDLLAAIDQSVADGVDVINYSIGGGSAATTVSATDISFLNAAKAGVFVAASAGNDGPDPSTLDNASPWITTVAASTIPSYEATAEFEGGEAYAGASISVQEELTAPVVFAGDVGLAGQESANLCLLDSLDPAKVEGKIVVCERGENARVEKSQAVEEAGGVGAIIVNVVTGSIDLDGHTIPTVHLDADVHDEVVAAAQQEGATVTLKPGNETGITPPTPQIAGFSSRGPVEADGSDVLKPDVSAPGVAILAATANAEGADPTWAFLSGTSMASPQVAGLGALYLGKKPNATPAEVKSALMTTAYDTVDAAGDPVKDVFAQGAGHVDPTRSFAPGLLYLNGEQDWDAYINGLGYDWAPGVEGIDASQLNLASISVGSLTAPETVTREVTVQQGGTYTASVEGLAGIDVEVSPATFTAKKGDKVSFEVTFTRTDAPLDEFGSGYLTWTSKKNSVRSPLAVRPVTIVAPDEVSGTGTTGSVDIEVTPGGDGDIPLQATGLSKGELAADVTGDAPDNSGEGAAGEEFEYEASVAEGASLARFDLDSIDDTADLDLVVYQLDAAGEPVAGWQSASGSADERVDLVEPEAGDYLVIVSVFAGETAWDLTTTSVVPGGAEIALEPGTLAGVQGEPIAYRASWDGLDEHASYLGLISYGDTGAVTALSVATGEAAEPEAPVNTTPPSITGEAAVGATLTADPGAWEGEGLEYAYQWKLSGADIEGATGETYRVAKTDQGGAISVAVTATGAAGTSTTVESEPVTVPWASTTKLSLSRNAAFSWQKVTATVAVSSPAETKPTGEVSFTIDGKKVALTATLDGEGKAKVTLPKLSSGIHVIKAGYAGDTDTTGSSSQSKILWIVF
ncbi:S8 family serine peptidase [Homoserinibacter sp. YIM 151385]|uniref:S8 family serine peptidase n=1 Tax=Homoserinibacter sp. YIM 151385 TaxID=2985506 RepID=UPI0022F0EC76|nr:S8 family serine peptidase [Homoserinibacter sp. YIM 151385]WBU36777.1 S8 family serine peptidase [Homoserinibacter sp. YIM 151385]